MNYKSAFHESLYFITIDEEKSTQHVITNCLISLDVYVDFLIHIHLHVHVHLNVPALIENRLIHVVLFY